MKVQRSYLMRVVQTWEGETPPLYEVAGKDDWPIDRELDDWPGANLGADADQYVCDNWELVSESMVPIEDDQLYTEVVEV